MAIKQRFSTFVKNIKPTEPHLTEARRQTDYMVEQLHNVVAADKTFELLKVLRAGSNAKHTSLLRNDDNVFDVDLGAYYSGTGATKAQLGTLLEFTHSKLWDVYKNLKDKKDFSILKSVCESSSGPESNCGSMLHRSSRTTRSESPTAVGSREMTTNGA